MQSGVVLGQGRPVETMALLVFSLSPGSCSCHAPCPGYILLEAAACLLSEA